MSLNLIILMFLPYVTQTHRIHLTPTHSLFEVTFRLLKSIIWLVGTVWHFKLARDSLWHENLTLTLKKVIYVSYRFYFIQCIIFFFFINHHPLFAAQFLMLFCKIHTKFLTQLIDPPLSGHILDLYCIWLSNAAPVKIIQNLQNT